MWLPHFANIEPARQISIEVGVTAQDYFILSQDLSKKDFLDPIGIKLTQNGKKIAGLSFIFSLDLLHKCAIIGTCTTKQSNN